MPLLKFKRKAVARGLFWILTVFHSSENIIKFIIKFKAVPETNEFICFLFKPNYINYEI